MFDRGIITVNEYRELMYLPQIDGGDVRQVSLNYVKTDDQTLYQTGKEDNGQQATAPQQDDGRRAEIKSFIQVVYKNADS